MENQILVDLLVHQYMDLKRNMKFLTRWIVVIMLAEILVQVRTRILLIEAE